jgi:hypothetical protein
LGYSKTRKIRVSTYDQKWSKFVRERDGACLVCGKTEYLAAHHFIRRGVKATRLDLDNGITLCASHHTFNYQFSAHRTPEAFDKWFKTNYPDRYRYVRKKAQQMMSERDAIAEFKEQYNLQ